MEFELCGWITDGGLTFTSVVVAIPADPGVKSQDRMERRYTGRIQALNGLLVMAEVMKHNIVGRGDSVYGLRVQTEPLEG